MSKPRWKFAFRMSRAEWERIRERAFAEMRRERAAQIERERAELARRTRGGKWNG